jgi:putative hydrolase of the HAD superfamily
MPEKLLFDWGNTIMVDFELPGPMYAWEKVAWVEGAEDAVKSLFMRYELSLATNAGASDTSGVIKALERVGAERFFKNIFLAQEIGYKKPDPRFFNYIIKRLNASPSSVVMIGDNYEKDIAGAKNAGLKTVFFNANHRKGPFDKADLVIENLKELPAMVDKL